MRKKMWALKNIFTSLGIIISILLILNGCSDSSTGPQNNSEIDGIVTNNDGFNKIAKTNGNVEGAVVTIAEIKEDGSIQTVSDQSVTTDVNGKFKLSAEGIVHRDIAARYVVVAVKDTNTWKAVITSKLESGKTIYCQPLNSKTSAESEIYVKAKQKNYTNLRYSRIAAYVRYLHRQTASSQDDAIAQALNAQAEAELYAASKSELGSSSSEWNSVLNEYDNAQVQLENRLYEESGTSGENPLYEERDQLRVSGAIKWMAPEALVKIKNISEVVFNNYIKNFPTDLRYQLKRRYAALKAEYLKRFTELQFSNMGAAQAEINVVVQAGIDLKVSINSAQTEDDIKTAFETYHAAVLTALQSTLNITANTMDEIKSDIAKFQADLIAAVSVSLSAEVVSTAYINFYLQVSNYLKAKELDKATPLLSVY